MKAMGKVSFVLSVLFLFCGGKAAAQSRFPLKMDSVNSRFSLRVLPQNFYIQTLPFSCKKELQLQKLTSLSIHFRLGSKEYVDYLEKKPNAIGNKQ